MPSKSNYHRLEDQEDSGCCGCFSTTDEFDNVPVARRSSRVKKKEPEQPKVSWFMSFFVKVEPPPQPQKRDLTKEVEEKQARYRAGGSYR